MRDVSYHFYYTTQIENEFKFHFRDPKLQKNILKRIFMNANRKCLWMTVVVTDFQKLFTQFAC